MMSVDVPADTPALLTSTVRRPLFGLAFSQMVIAQSLQPARDVILSIIHLHNNNSGLAPLCLLTKQRGAQTEPAEQFQQSRWRLSFAKHRTMPANFEILPISISKAFLLAVSVWIGVGLMTGAANADPITIFTTELDGHHQPDLRGRYDQIVLSAARQQNLDVDFRFMPPARAILQFSKCEDCCVSPCNEDPEISHCPGATLSDVWDKVELHAFSLRPDASDLAIDNLKTLDVGAIQGMPLGTKVETNLADIRRVDTPRAAVNMLTLGRLDVFLGWIPETLVYFRVNDIPVPNYDAKHPMKSVPIGIACKGSQSLRLIDAVNTYLRQAPQTSGTEPISSSNPDG